MEEIEKKRKEVLDMFKRGEIKSREAVARLHEINEEAKKLRRKRK